MIYVITFCGNSHDDTPINLVATPDKAAAERELKRRQDQHDRIAMIHAELRALFRAYQAANKIEMLEIPPYPKGQSKPTKEQAAEHRRAVNAYRKGADRIWKINTEIHDEWQQKATVAMKEAALRLDPTLTEDDLRQITFPYGYFQEGSFEIEEVPTL
jgi:hypothetical protein